MAKRRDRGDGSVSQRASDGMWRAQLDVGHVNGKRRRKTRYASTRQGALAALREMKQQVAAGDLTTSSMRLEVWLRYWLDDIAALKVKPRTLVDYRSKVEGYIIPTIGRHRLDRLSAAHVRELHRWMRGKGLKERTILHTHMVLAGALRHAESEVGLPRNVARQVPPPTAAQAETRALSPAECKAILDAATEDRVRWLFALYTGTRQGESLGLQWDRVDLELGTAEISWALQRVPYVHGCKADGKATCGHRPHGCPSKRLGIPPAMECQILDGNLCLIRPKTARSVRTIDLVPGLIYALRKHQDADAGANPHGLVWHRKDGRPVDGRADYRAWQQLLARAGVPPIPLHGTRHATASLMLNRGVPEAVRMAILGHAQQTTHRVYAHADRDLTRAAMDAVAKAIEG